MTESSDQFGFPAEPLILSGRWVLGDIFRNITKCQFVARLLYSSWNQFTEPCALITCSDSGTFSGGKLKVWSSEVRIVAIIIVVQYRGKSFGLKMSMRLSRDLFPSPSWIRFGEMTGERVMADFGSREFSTSLYR